MKKINSAKAIGDLVSDYVLGQKDPPMSETVQQILQQRWLQHAGNAGIHSQPLLFQSGRLVVYTLSPIWATELRHQQHKIMSGLADLGATHFTIRTTPTVAANSGPVRRQVRVSSEAQQNIALVAKHLNHRELRNALTRLAQRAAEKNRTP